MGQVIPSPFELLEHREKYQIIRALRSNNWMKSNITGYRALPTRHWIIKSRDKIRAGLF